MRNISFSLTTRQFKAREKTVTRRLGWRNLKVGVLLMGCKKCQGLKRGEKLEHLGAIRVTSVEREHLWMIRYRTGDCAKEGFPDMEPEEFIEMFCREMNCSPETIVTRIEFEHLQKELTKTEQIVPLLEHLSNKMIADVVVCSAELVRQVREYYGIPSPMYWAHCARKIDEDLLTRILKEVWYTDKPLSTIEDELRLTRRTVSRICKKFGVDTQGRKIKKAPSGFSLWPKEKLVANCKEGMRIRWEGRKDADSQDGAANQGH